MPVDPGNTLSTALGLGDLTANISLNKRDMVGPSDPIDLYRFKLSASNSISLNLEQLSANADLRLLDSNGTVIRSSTNSGTTAEAITIDALQAGTYFIQVASAGGLDTNYNLRVAASGVEINPGNTIPLAFDLGTFSGFTYTFPDQVGTADTQDYFKVQLVETRILNVGLSELSANADIELLNSSGTVIGRSSNTGTLAESIVSQPLAAGDYYIRVFSVSGDTSYSLRVQDTTPDFVGNTRETAQSLPVDFIPTVRSESVDSSDLNDYYRVDLTTSTTLKVSLGGLFENADLELLNSSGGLITRSALPGITREDIVSTLSAGTYYIRVYPATNSAGGVSSTDYSLSVLIDSAGDTLPNARNILLGTSTPAVYRDGVSPQDSNDYYRFQLNTQSDFRLTLNGLSANADVELLDSTGGLILRQNASGITSEVMNRSLQAGTYFIRVYGEGTTTRYDLGVSALPTDLAGNTLADARVITIGTTPLVLQDGVYTFDTNDYYRFTLSDRSNFNLALTNLQGDADIQLLDSTGTIVASSTGEATQDEFINNVLNAGTYYVRVYPGASSVNTPYRLLLSTSFVSNLLPVEVDGGTLPATRTRYTGTISDTNTSDLLRFQLSGTSNFSLSLTGLSTTAPNDADVRLIQDTNGNGIIDASDNLVRSTFGVGISDRFIVPDLPAGTYFVQVYQIEGSTPYTLDLIAAPVT